MKQQNIWSFIGYFSFIYLLLMLFILIGYPLAKEFATPWVSMIFPLDPSNSLLKNIIVVTSMYWGVVLLYLVAQWKKLF